MNNETIDTLKSRRSIREFQDRQVADAALDVVLEAGTYAPTGMGMQSPKIVAVQEEKTLQKLRHLNQKILGADSDPYYGAPTILLVFADQGRSTWVQDGSCVLCNMMNAAHSVGLGSCWIHREREMFETREGRALMKEWGIAECYGGIGALALGYCAGEMPEAAPRKDGYILKIK